MRAFEVHLNGKKLCLAGVDGHGVLTVITSSVAGERGSDLFLQVGGLLSAPQEHVDWVNQRPLSIGDEIQVKIVDTDSVDDPVGRRKSSSEEDLRSRKTYVRAMAEKLGWTIREGPQE